MTEQVGRVLGGRYRLLAPIGSGASGNVFLAEDVALRRRVAVKLLHAALAADEPFLRRFQAEARAAAALSHPNVMSVYDWGEGDEGPFLVLELLSGGSLRNLLDRTSLLTPSQALKVGLQASRGLAYAHRRGLVHRDIKPANLLFDDEGRCKIADFGVARALAEAAWTEPMGAVIGSARYASPEQAKGASLDGRSDVYSLAIVLVEAVTGQVPFAADTTIATLMGRVDTPLVAPSEMGPLGPVVELAGKPDPADRPDAAAFATALEEAASELPRPQPLPVGEAVTIDLSSTPDPDPTVIGRASATTTVTPTPAPRPAPADDAPLLSPAAARPRRRWPLLAALIALVVFAVAGVAYAVVQSTIPTHPVPSVVGKTVAQAKVEVTDEKFDISVADRKSDESVEAGRILSQSPNAGTKLKEDHAVRVVVSSGPAPRHVPDLSNTDQARADQLLREQALTPKFVPRNDETAPKGKVLDWQPRGEVPRGAEVTVTISDGPAPRPVPGDLKGKSFEEAKAELDALGLVAVRSDDYTDDVQLNQVFATVPGAGTKVPVGGKVTVKVSKGPATVAVPNVAGRSVDQATAIIEQAGLTVTGVFGPPKGTVFTTNPSAGTKIPRGRGVDLYTRR